MLSVLLFRLFTTDCLGEYLQIQTQIQFRASLKLADLQSCVKY